MTARSNTALLASALEYAARGWAVFPILPDLGGLPHGSARQRPPKLRLVDWERWATTDSARISRTWEKHPWGIAIACGVSNLLVVESELTEGNLMPGENYLYRMAGEHGSLPATWTVAAPNGNLIRYYEHPAEPITTTTLTPHLRIRGHGQYTIAPPTVTVVGTWQLLQNRPVAPLPQWLAEVLTNGRS